MGVGAEKEKTTVKPGSRCFLPTSGHSPYSSVALASIPHIIDIAESCLSFHGDFSGGLKSFCKEGQAGKRDFQQQAKHALESLGFNPFQISNAALG